MVDAFGASAAILRHDIADTTRSESGADEELRELLRHGRQLIGRLCILFDFYPLDNEANFTLRWVYCKKFDSIANRRTHDRFKFFRQLAAKANALLGAGDGGQVAERFDDALGRFVADENARQICRRFEKFAAILRFTREKRHKFELWTLIEASRRNCRCDGTRPWDWAHTNACGVACVDESRSGGRYSGGSGIADDGGRFAVAQTRQDLVDAQRLVVREIADEFVFYPKSFE